MKKCPYCAEEIQDEAIKCRYCFSDLTVPPPTSGEATPAGQSAGTAGAAATGPSPVSSSAPSSGTAPSSSPADGPAPTGADPATTASAGPTTSVGAQWGGTTAQPGAASDGGQVQYTHSGHRYVLGYGPDFFGIWDRQASGAPAERFPRNDDGWRQAWTRFAGLEPHHVAVPQTAQMTPAVTPSGTQPVDNDALQYTHSGQRYLLGYGRTFFGIWDRTSPVAPVERFSRDDAGWQQAWHRFTSLETHYTEVGLGGAGAGPASPAGGTPTPGP